MTSIFIVEWVGTTGNRVICAFETHQQARDFSTVVLGTIRKIPFQAFY